MPSEFEGLFRFIKVNDTSFITKTDPLSSKVRCLLTLLFLFPAAALEMFDIVALNCFL